MTRKKRLVLTGLASVAGLLVLLCTVALIVIQTQWFADFVRQKVISVAEESTGGKVEIGSFQFQWSHLTVRIRNFVLHGTEPQDAAPLVKINLLELRLKLFAGLKKAVDLAYLGVEQPQVNLIVNPDGTTNIPEPKVKKQPDQTSGLQTVVDLAVNQFQINNGLLLFSQKKTTFAARGEQLHVLLNYRMATPSYEGLLQIDPLRLTSGTEPPLNVHVKLPITLTRDAVSVAEGRFFTDLSNVLVSAELHDINSPKISAHLNANVSLAEMQQSFALPIETQGREVPKYATAEVMGRFDQQANVVQLDTVHLAMGQTTFQASGTMDASRNKTVAFNGNLALGELAKLAKVSEPRVRGELDVNGSAGLDAHNNYSVNGTVNSKALAIQGTGMGLLPVTLYTPFHADPFLISLDGLKVDALRGRVGAKVFIEKMQQLSVEAALSNLSLPVLAATFGGHPLAYDGTINGTVKANDNLTAKGTSGLSALLQVGISPGTHGVPVSGQIRANYVGATGAVDLGKSYVAMPNSRIDLSGAINRELAVTLVSKNLSDFLPAANFGAAKPESSLPVVLHGGTATISATVRGNLSNPKLAAHAAITQFSVEGSAFDELTLDIGASSAGVSVQNGVLNHRSLQTTFDASLGLHRWKPLPGSSVRANLMLRNGDLSELVALSGASSVAASGATTADVHIGGTYGDPTGVASFQVLNGMVDNQPFQRIGLNVNLSHQLVSLTNAEVDAAGGRISANGTFRHPRDSFTTGHAEFHVTSNNVQLANLKALQQKSPGVAGAIALGADAAADLREVNKKTEITVSNIAADLTGRGLRVNNQDAGSLTATARTNAGRVSYNVRSDFAGSQINVDGRTLLSGDFDTSATATIQGLRIEKALDITGQGSIPANGLLSADARVSGNLKSPEANLNFTFLKGKVYQEPIDRLTGSVSYSEKLVNIPALDLATPAGSLSLAGSYSHPAGDLGAGALNVRVKSTDIELAKIQHVQQAKPDLAGTFKLAADVAGNVSQKDGKQQFLISTLNADAATNALSIGGKQLGELTFAAHTQQAKVNFQLDSDLAGSQIHGSGETGLTGDYSTRASLTFTKVQYGNIAPLISSENLAKPPFDALVEGRATVNGPLLDTDVLTARLELNRLDVRSNPQGSPTGAPATRTVDFQNDGPIVVALDKSVIRVEQLKIKGPGTAISAAGGINLKNSSSPLGLTLKADADLGVLQDVDRDFYSSGSVEMDAIIRGSIDQPLVNGKVELRNANVNYSQSSNGLSNANGVILLNGTNATIQNLTGESGGGKIAATGFVGFSPSALIYNLRATATRVRTRYEDVSVTSSATITLIGNSRRSLLGGTVTIHRIAYSSNSDAGSILTAASTPPSTPTEPSPLLAGMRLDIRIVTAPDLRVVTTYAERLDVFANLTVRGTAASPGVLGRINVTDGQLVFFGNSYIVNSGSINFYDPESIQPVVDLSLETIAQGVDVLIGVTGPISDLKLSYRSDPPLTFEQIVQLLATNTTPSDPTIAAHQPTPPQQSLSEMGESAVLGQAIANPLASRVQRVFGLTQFKIDPTVSGSNGTSARVTLQEKVASNVTFTYITDVTQTNSEIIRVEVDLSPKVSAVALRDFNGNVSVEIFYKFKVR